MSQVFKAAVKDVESRLSVMVEGRLLQMAEGAAKHYNLNIKPKDDINWSKFIKEAETNSETFEIIKLKCSRVLRTGNYLEPILSQWLCDYLDGVIKQPPKSKGGQKNREAEISFRSYYRFGTPQILFANFKKCSEFPNECMRCRKCIN